MTMAALQGSLFAKPKRAVATVSRISSNVRPCCRYKTISRSSTVGGLFSARSVLGGISISTKTRAIPVEINGEGEYVEKPEGFEQPSWYYEDEVDMTKDRVLAQVLYEVMRGVVPIEHLFKNLTTLKPGGFLTLVIAASQARQWQAAQNLYEYFLQHADTSSVQTTFWLHIAFRRMEDEQYAAAFETFCWLKDTGRAPSGAALELFGKVCRRCENPDEDSNYKVAHEWFEKSDVGRALWHIYMAKEGDAGTVYMDIA
ncbi:hypothetical protein CYMTET_44818 [Cymbomonas tetramitiformis]|uniref:Uncharacterized protein n=1 Tax=Cymbomonas tetramitiformis TaxID=36881 RepID=A0AAE0C0N0_9CHLO|nr:hypothetical protein CYMTET_44818 [Cymbomonas tetramitiformis]